MGSFDELRRQVQGSQSAAPAAADDEGLRRERGTGIPTLLTLGALGAGLMAARSPGGRRALERVWQKPLGFAEKWTGGRPVSFPGIDIPGLPSPLPLLHAKPRSTLVSDVERVGSNLSRTAKEYFEDPATAYVKQDPELIKDIEHARVANFLSRMATGVPAHVAKAQSLAGAPQWFRDADAYRTSLFTTANRAKDFMGMARTPERFGPYWARETIRPEGASLRGPRGGFGQLRTSAGPAEKGRVFPTMRAGEQAGIRYEDPRIAAIHRDLHDMQIIETAGFMQRLENRVAFRSRAAAEAIAGTTKVYEIEPLPGAPRWWVPHYEEWKLLHDQLRDPNKGQMAFLGSWANALARNPNLVNPLPHIIKNMAFKYAQAGGPALLRKLPGDYMEFRQGTSPMVTMFKHWMPFDESGQTAIETFERVIHGIKRERYPAPVRLVDLALDATVGKAHRMSTKVIFGKADPAMRFSLWKSYVEKGMHPAEAAQHVWIDLINYGDRSTVVDFWKSVPFNFFVPWRLGTVTSLYKQLSNHPFRTAMFIGGIDLLREIRYRKTGRWTHLPIDYVEQPIAQALQGKDLGDSARSLVAATLATVIAGPGGAFAIATLIDVFKDVQMTGDWNRLKNMFWGISQLVDGGASAISIIRDIAAGNHQKAATDAQNLLMTAATAEHSALNYRPRRLLAALPEVGPWLQKSAQVKAAEGMQQAIELLGDRAQKRRDMRKRLSIEDRVKAGE